MDDYTWIVKRNGGRVNYTRLEINTVENTHVGTIYFDDSSAQENDLIEIYTKFKSQSEILLLSFLIFSINDNIADLKDSLWLNFAKKRITQGYHKVSVSDLLEQWSERKSDTLDLSYIFEHFYINDSTLSKALFRMQENLPFRTISSFKNGRLIFGRPEKMQFPTEIKVDETFIPPGTSKKVIRINPIPLLRLNTFFLKDKKVIVESVRITVSGYKNSMEIEYD